MQENFGPFGSESAYMFHEMIKNVELGEEGGRRFFAKGEAIFEEGRHPRGLFCIIKGKAKIYRINEYGREQIIRLHGPNDVIGYKSLVMETPYNATAIALEDTSLGFINKEAFDKLIDNNLRIARLFMKILCQNLEQSDSFLVSLTSKNMKEKTAGVLLFLYEKFGLEPDMSLAVSLSREEMAGMVGLASENISRALTQLKEEGIIGANGRKITLLHLERLRQASGQL
ncbi:MAG: Crp/Fnr family transcriptional regulator [Bacteroidetes bacterium]|nr:Crp/Fnr family transcriptional regulator [Bacteroidota bacterium]